MIKPARSVDGANFSPYTFNNPSLEQIGIEVPMNEPMLSHVDIIRGDITGMIDPSDDAYTTERVEPDDRDLADRRQRPERWAVTTRTASSRLSATS